MILCDNCSPRNQCTADKNRTECRFYQPMTNEEWFCGLSTEEKARTIIQKTIELRMARKWSERHIIEWLKQPHKPFS